MEKQALNLLLQNSENPQKRHAGCLISELPMARTHSSSSPLTTYKGSLSITQHLHHQDNCMYEHRQFSFNINLFDNRNTMQNFGNSEERF